MRLSRVRLEDTRRYEVVAYGWPTPDKSTIGFSDRLPVALRMLVSALKAPSAERGHVHDHVTGKAYHLTASKKGP